MFVYARNRRVIYRLVILCFSLRGLFAKNAGHLNICPQFSLMGSTPQHITETYISFHILERGGCGQADCLGKNSENHIFCLENKSQIYVVKKI